MAIGAKRGHDDPRSANLLQCFRRPIIVVEDVKTTRVYGQNSGCLIGMSFDKRAPAGGKARTSGRFRASRG